ncbi:hypothetical protein [Brevibacillus centrosporus]|uniref:hypothetical protein n=1 Tax=Brevibacillus centrosporus TaxID=54910 RepID=UPI003B029E5A
MGAIQCISEKVGYKEMTFLEGDRTFTKFIPKVHVNGKYVLVSDKTTKSGLMECADPNSAILAAKTVKNELRARLGI